MTDLTGKLGPSTILSDRYTPRARKALELALREALQLGHSQIGTEHILLGLIREGEGVAASVLLERFSDLGQARQLVIGKLKERERDKLTVEQQVADLQRRVAYLENHQDSGE